MWAIDRLSRNASPPTPGVRVVYVSPLKALAYDIERNLRAPLAGIRRVAKEQAAPLPKLDVMVRTGDTPQHDRRRMLRTPPEILITTPESLGILLLSEGGRQMLSTLIKAYRGTATTVRLGIDAGYLRRHVALLLQ